MATRCRGCPGFVHSDVHPLVVGRRRALPAARRYGPAAACPAGVRTAIVLVSASGDRRPAPSTSPGRGRGRRAGRPAVLLPVRAQRVAGHSRPAGTCAGRWCCPSPTGDPSPTVPPRPTCCWRRRRRRRGVAGSCRYRHPTRPTEAAADDCPIGRGRTTMRTAGTARRAGRRPGLGAGNVLAQVLAHGADPDGPGADLRHRRRRPPGRGTPLTLGELDERVAARAAWLHAARRTPPRPGRRLGHRRRRLRPQLPGPGPARRDPGADERQHAGRDRRRVHPPAAGRRRARRRRPRRAAGRARPRRTRPRRRRREAGTGDPAAAPRAVPAPPRRPDRDHPLLRHHRGAQGGGALARQPLRGHPAPAHRAAGAGHQRILNALPAPHAAGS